MPAAAASAWPARLAIALAAPCAFVLSEWLFFVTKPSFLNALPAGEQLLVLLRVAAWLMLPFAAATGLAWAVARAAGPGALGRAAVLAARLLPALAVAATLLLLLDNFLYTVTGWGTPRLEGPLRWLGTAAFLGLLAAVAPRVGRWEAALEGRPRLRRALELAAAFVALVGLAASAGGGRVASGPTGGSTRRWNVVLVGGDGISAERLASFGGRRTTTPFLDGLAADSLLALNVFPNADATGGSLTSLLNGALPSDTRVIYPPDIARGPWRYRHLPGLLRRLGYATGQFTLRWYADSVDLNLQESFDWANGRDVAPRRRLAWTRHLDADASYLLGLVTERLVERVVPSAATRAGRDAYREVIGQRLKSALSDVSRIEELREFVDSARRPFFAHIHLLGTHSAPFYPSVRRFSRGKMLRHGTRLDFYDDAIGDFDRHLEEIVRGLAASGELERTLLVVYSDHGREWGLYDRVPLLFRAPGGALRGRVERRPAQLVDVAPTLLELLGQPIPDWMRGRSLLDPERDPCPEILSFGHAKIWSQARGKKFFGRATPPFYSLATAALAVGEHSVTLDLDLAEVTSRRLALAGGAGALCPPLAPLPAAERIVDHLAAQGYDVSSLRGRLSVRDEAGR